MPIGAPMARPSAVMIRLPTMALSKPPFEPGGGVIWVKTASDRPPNPFHTKAARIKVSQPRPKIVAATHRIFAAASTRRRARYFAISTRLYVEAHQQQPRSD